MAYPPNNNDLSEAKTTIVNILKMEGYKLNSGELFVAFKEAGGEMSDFKGALEELTSEGKIKSDADGNIMTVEDYQREKSQTNDKEETEEIIDDNEDDLESIIKLKEETDSWLIEKLKNNGTDDSLRDEVKELKERVAKLEKIISNLTRAFD